MPPYTAAAKGNGQRDGQYPGLPSSSGQSARNSPPPLQTTAVFQAQIHCRTGEPASTLTSRGSNQAEKSIPTSCSSKPRSKTGDLMVDRPPEIHCPSTHPRAISGSGDILGRKPIRVGSLVLGRATTGNLVDTSAPRTHKRVRIQSCNNSSRILHPPHKQWQSTSHGGQQIHSVLHHQDGRNQVKGSNRASAPNTDSSSLVQESNDSCQVHPVSREPGSRPILSGDTDQGINMETPAEGLRPHSPEVGNAWHRPVRQQREQSSGEIPDLAFRPTSMAVGTDAMKWDWDQENLVYAFPHVSMIWKVLQN